jgi:hypothetical protein
MNKNTSVTMGAAIIFGLVLDPKGTWGVAIVEVASEPEVRILGRNDPAG